MDRPSSPPNAIGLPVEHLFKDIYRLLEAFQESKEKFGSIATHVARCQHELTGLERIHTNRWRFHAPDANDDPFQLRETCNKFAISCNALKYVNSPMAEFGEDVPDGCLPPMSLKRSWRKKHLKNLEAEFWGHERALSMALSNAVYTTVLQMQRAKREFELSLAQILRRSERRHHIFESLDNPIRSMDRSKLENFRMEEMDWELCLRRYMDHMETWSLLSRGSDLAARPTASSSSSQGSGGSIRLQNRGSNSSLRSSYGEYRISGELDTSIYYRQPRRNSLHGNTAPQSGELVRSNSSSSIHSSASTALVVYNQPPAASSGPSGPSGTSNMTAVARPVRRASISRDFNWEYVGRSSTFGMLAPVAAKCPELKDAQADIFAQTQGMTLLEARAYAQGRLASLPPEVTDEVKSILSLRRQQKDGERGRSRVQRRLVDESRPPAQSTVERRSLSLDPKRSSLVSLKQANRLEISALEALRQESRPKPIKPLVKPVEVSAPKPPPLPISAPKAKAKKSKSKSRMRDLRPLTAISEKSVFPKPKTSGSDKPPGSRSIMQAFAARKSSLSVAEVSPVSDVPESSEVPAVPEIYKEISEASEIPKSIPEETKENLAPPTPSSSKASASDSDKSRLRSMDSKSTSTSSSSNNKPLPPNPKFSKSSLLAIFRSRQSKGLTSTPSSSSIGNLTNPSKESIRRVSMDLLKRKDSKMTLFSVAEGVEVPLEMSLWLRALPYIEGRARTPQPPPVSERL